MLADFQQALADVTASPDLCQAVRDDERALVGYDLDERERQRLLGIARHPGMAAACTVYRMNRLAPLAMNLRATLRALGDALRPQVHAYWCAHPRGHAHFFIEADRFCGWLQARIDAGQRMPAEARHALAQDHAAVRAALAASITVER